MSYSGLGISAELLKRVAEDPARSGGVATADSQAQLREALRTGASQVSVAPGVVAQDAIPIPPMCNNIRIPAQEAFEAHEVPQVITPSYDLIVFTARLDSRYLPSQATDRQNVVREFFTQLYDRLNPPLRKAGPINYEGEGGNVRFHGDSALDWGDLWSDQADLGNPRKWAARDVLSFRRSFHPVDFGYLPKDNVVWWAAQVDRLVQNKLAETSDSEGLSTVRPLTKQRLQQFMTGASAAAARDVRLGSGMTVLPFRIKYDRRLSTPNHGQWRRRFDEGDHPIVGNTRTEIDDVSIVLKDALGDVFIPFFTQLFMAPAVDRTLRQAERDYLYWITKIETAAHLIANHEAIIDRAIGAGEEALRAANGGDLEPLVAVRAIQQLRSALQDAVATIQLAVQRVRSHGSMLPRINTSANEAVVSVKAGLTAAEGRLARHLGPEATASQTNRARCLLYRKANEEAREWPPRFRSLLPNAATAEQALAAALPQMPTALGAYAAGIERLAEIEGQVDLPWWQRDFGPLPVWGWGLVGTGTVLGGAYLLRRARKKRVAKNRRRRRTSRAA